MRLIKGMTIAAASALVVAMSYGCSSTTTVVDNTDTGAPTPEAGARDTSSPIKDTGPLPDTNMTACAPVDVTGYTPAAYVPAATKIGACTHQEILDFDADCFNQMTATSAKCSAYQKASPNCVACMQTPDTAAAWGPVIGHGSTTVSLNLGGCMELEGNKACGTSFQALTGCDAKACDAVCPVMSGDGGASINALNACYTSADSGGCMMYNSAVTACSNDDGGPITTNCRPTDFDSGIVALGQIFCGYADGG